ncbi:hypothetical protein AMTRI_Chr12g235410 [Amborella trichopoda]
MLMAVQQLEAAKCKKHKQRSVYDFKLLSDLLSFIWNVYVHFSDRQQNIKKFFSNCCTEIYKPFEDIFPKLFMKMHGFAQQQRYHTEDQFKIFFGKAMT